MKYYTFSIEVQPENVLEIRDELLESEGKRSIFDADKLICEEQLISAVHRADRAFDQKVNIANIWGIEVLLHLSANHQISSALGIIGIDTQTTRIGIVQETNELPHRDAENILRINNPGSKVLDMYGINDDDPCTSIISKGVQMIADNE